MKLRNIVIAVFLLALIAWGVYDYAQKSKEQEEAAKSTQHSAAVPGVGIGNAAYDFTLTDTNGGDMKLSELRGKKVLLNFWATWCPPCRVEMPELEKFAHNKADDDIIVLGVNLTKTEGSSQDVVPFVQKNNISFPVVLDLDGSVMSQYKVIAYPTSFIIDEQGIIRNIYQGAINYDIMNQAFKELD